MSEDYDPFEYPGDTAVPRQEGFKEETEEICRYIREERGDQRIGQYLINVLNYSDKWEEMDEDLSYEEKVTNLLYNIEASELLKTIKEFEDRGESQ